MPADSQPPELIRLGPFGGYDTTTSLLWTADSPATATGGTGYVLDRSYQAFVTTLGRTRLFTAPVPVVLGFAGFSLDDETDEYLICGDSGVPTQGAVFIAPQGGPASQITPLPTTLTAGQPTEITQYGGWAFLSNAVDTPIKISTSLAATFWGVSAPTNMASAITNGAGMLSATNAYYYEYTFANDVQESSPSLQPVTAFGGLFSGNTALVGPLQVCSDPQITEVNIYRSGGDSGQAGTYIFAGSVANGTTYFLDNTADGELTGGDLVAHRDPPQPFWSICEWQDRVFGFGYSGTAVGTTDTPANSDLWYSNYAEPWGFDDTNQVIPVGRNSGDDIAVGQLPLADLLLLRKRRSLWCLPGPPPVQPIPLYDLGSDSPYSGAVVMGQAFWLGDDNCIYTFGGGSYVDLGLPIQSFLDTLTATDRAASNAAAWDHCYVLSFPTLGQSVRYDLRTSTWAFLPFSFDRSASRTGHPNPLIMLASEEDSGSIDQWFTGETDRGFSLGAQFVSKLFDCGDARYAKALFYGLLVASIEETTMQGQVTITVTADPGTSTENSTQKVINLQQNLGSYIFELPQSVNGRYFQITIATSSMTRLEVDRLSFYGNMDYALVPNVQ